ncbi:ATP synthase F1 subunit delta [Limnochorda pilosa]|uniref:ATP synthase subunit delta n=1 Tax=Limnochorda pilosa TaxID=1555112 RepID=A0A0K2SP56_LIMPI|nr:ATP synthase F1 subunit delta [Limnochorda pilosa]BAS28918.1 F0F1 ATP synthase subunit delta [Limnochorda pilosa]
MRAGKLARRYAQALAELAAERGLLDPVQEQAQLLAGVLDEEPTLLMELDDDRIPREERLGRLRELFGERFSPLFYHFLRLVLEKGRATLLPEICAEVPRAIDRLKGVVEADVVTAAPLAEEQREAVRTRLEAITGRAVRLAVREDPGLLGGVVVRLGDLVMDGSVATRLKRLEDRLKLGRSGTGEMG